MKLCGGDTYKNIWLKIKVPHPSYPSTRVSVQVPNLGIHLSPARYYRIMELLSMLYDTMENCGQSTVDNFQAQFAPWSSADIATDARILVWKVWAHVFNYKEDKLVGYIDDEREIVTI